MGERLVAQMLPTLRKLKLSDNAEATMAGFKAFEVGRDKVDAYRGDPKALGEALRIFQTADSLPYQYAGIAYTLIAASEKRDAEGQYDQTGLDAAMEWLEKAQELAPDLTDINVIEPFIYIYGDRFDDARLVLDYLHQYESNNYYLCRAEVALWQRKGDLEQAIEWSRRAIDAAATIPQRLRMRNIVADLYLEKGDVDHALQTYREALHFNPENAWLYHKVSVIHLQQGALEEAAQFNARALELEPDLEEALELRQALSQKSEGTTGILGRLFN